MRTETNRNCIHSRQVQALFDGQVKGKFLTEHVSNCPACLKKYELIKMQEEQLAMSIPFQLIPEDMKNSLQLDIGSVTDVLDRHVKEIRGRSRKNVISFMQNMMRDIYLSIARPIPLASLAVVAVTLILKIYL